MRPRGDHRLEEGDHGVLGLGWHPVRVECPRTDPDGHTCAVIERIEAFGRWAVVDGLPGLASVLILVPDIDNVVRRASGLADGPVEGQCGGLLHHVRCDVGQDREEVALVVDHLGDRRLGRRLLAQDVPDLVGIDDRRDLHGVVASGRACG